MGQHGLQEVVDAAAFLDPDAPPRAGAVVCPAMHGSRCLLIETQALGDAGGTCRASSSKARFGAGR